MTDSRVTITKVRNSRGETIEVGYIVTIIDQEDRYGTGEVYRLQGPETGKPGRWFALVRWEQAEAPRRYDWMEVDELTNVNVARREKALGS